MAVHQQLQWYEQVLRSSSRKVGEIVIVAGIPNVMYYRCGSTSTATESSERFHRWQSKGPKSLSL